MNTRRTGQYAMWLLAPQIALGAALAVFPDIRFPRIAQVLVLLHVASAVASILAALAWIAIHVRRAQSAAASISEQQSPARRSGRMLVAAGIVAAYATGIWDAWGGEGSRAGDWHAAVGLIAGLPLAAHLLLDGQGAARRLAFLYCLIAPLALPSARAAVRHRFAPGPTPIPPFAMRAQDPALFDRAEWCGSCHVDQFEEWRHSVHARALSIPHFRAGFVENIHRKGLDHVDGDIESPDGADGEHCPRCHAPITFYGRNPQIALHDTMTATQGISCAFCHTVRGREGNKLFNSAPQSVARYFGQGAPTTLLRNIGDLLIRWRPARHRQDYRAPFLSKSAFCWVCHHEAYEGWVSSPYAGASSDPEIHGVVECQDCHMSHKTTFGPVEEPGRLVPWGPIRPQKRFHGVAARNVRAATSFQDPVALANELRLRPGMMTMRIARVHRAGTSVHAEAILHNNHVGHYFPTGESGDVAAAFLDMQLLDKDGTAIRESARPTEALDFTELDLPGRVIPLIPQYADSKLLREDRRVPPRKDRAFSLSLPEDASAVRVRVRLRSVFEPGSIVEAEAEIPR